MSKEDIQFIVILMISLTALAIAVTGVVLAALALR